jgi:hypothetical protein
LYISSKPLKNTFRLFKLQYSSFFQFLEDRFADPKDCPRRLWTKSRKLNKNVVQLLDTQIRLDCSRTINLSIFLFS